MLRWKRVEISAGALLLGAALYYLDEQGVLLMAFCACALHELGPVSYTHLTLPTT